MDLSSMELKIKPTTRTAQSAINTQKTGKSRSKRYLAN